jgi:nitrilase
VNIYCAPTVDSRDTWPGTMRHIAIEGRTFVISACQYARRSDFPGVWHLESENDEELIKGGSMIISPLGEILVHPLRGTEGVKVAEIDLTEVIRGKFDLDVVGHYARYDPGLSSAKDIEGTFSGYPLICIRQVPSEKAPIIKEWASINNIM